MKRYFIILLALIILCAMPVLASTPEQENALLSSEDELFLGEMSQLSEAQLSKITGNEDLGATVPKPTNTTNTSSSSSTNSSSNTSNSKSTNNDDSLFPSVAAAGYFLGQCGGGIPNPWVFSPFKMY